MKLKSIYSMALSALLFAACSNNNEPEVFEESVSDNLLRIESVAQEGFTSSASTRATYEGYATKFENEDKLGVILVDADGNRIGHGAFRFDGNNWTNLNLDNTQYYTGKIEKVITYFPYNETLPATVNTVEALKEAFTPGNDQSTLDKFKQADLLVCELTGDAVKSELTINFSHAFSMIALSAESSIQVDGQTYTYNIDMSNVAMALGDRNIMPYVLNGTYVCLVKDGTALENGSFRYFYNIGGETSVKTVNTLITTATGTRYTFPCPAKGDTGDTPELKAGDFYCVTADNQSVVVIPGNAASIPAGLTCKGVVFHVMDETAFGEFATANSLTGTDYAGIDDKHGLLISPTAGKSFGINADETNKPILNEAFKAVNNYNNPNAANGYALTAALKGTTIYESVTALTNHTEKLTNATNWYIPSYHELKYLIRGTDITTESGDGMTFINQQLSKVAGSNTLEGAIPSITVNNVKFTGFVMMNANGTQGWNGGIPGNEQVRPICAF